MGIDDESNVNEQQTDKQEMVAMHNFNYILNASFWINILKTDDLLDNKLSIIDAANAGFTSAEIVNTVNYNNINLDKQSIDFIDTFSTEHDHGQFGGDDDNKFSHFHRKSRQLSMSGIKIDRKVFDEIDINDDGD